MKFLRLGMLSCACLVGVGSMSAQNISESSGAHGFVEDRNGNSSAGINIPEDRDGSVAGLTQVTTQWTNKDAVAVHYFHHPAAMVKTSMVLKVTAGRRVNFKVRVYDPVNLTSPLFSVDTYADGTGESQEIPLVEYNFPKRGYYRYCIECTSGCTDIIEISKFKHNSPSSEKTYKSGYLSSPSVHLNNWGSTAAGAPTGENYDWCYNEVMMPKESDLKGTYVMSMGLMNGYMGIQMNGYENNKSRHDIIFSIWDKGSTDIDPNLPDNLRAKLVDKNDLATNERFGNEGTGMKSFMAGHFWEAGTFVQFITNCRKEVATYVDKDGKTQTQENTLVSAWFNAQDGKGWQYISTLRMPAQHKRFDSWYSFLENFNWPTGQLMRKGYYRNGYGCDGNGNWFHFNKVNASHTDGGRDGQGNEIAGQRYDYGFGQTEECVGPNGEKAFFMSTGGYVPAKENSTVVPLNAKNTAVDTIQLDVLLKRVNLAIEHEKKAKEDEEFYSKYRLDKQGWKVVNFSSEETKGEGSNGRAAQIIDGNNDTYWHSAWNSGSSRCPHELVVDMNDSQTFEMMDILMSGGNNRHIKSFHLDVSDDNQSWKTVYTDNQVVVASNESFRFRLPQPETARYFKLVITASSASGADHVRINEINLAGMDAKQILVNNTEKLLEQMGVVRPNISLQTKDESKPGYLYCNAPYTIQGNDYSNVENGYNLLDNDIKTHLHTDYSGKNSKDGLDHYLRVDLGEGNAWSEFTFRYETRDNYTAERPEVIVVEGSNTVNGDYTLIETLNDLPNSQATAYKKKIVSSEPYRYLRFRVTDTYGNVNKGGHKFFSMASFYVNSVKLAEKDVSPSYQDCLVEIENTLSALSAVENSLVSDNKENLYNELQQSYDALLKVYQRRETAKENLLALIEQTKSLVAECGEISSQFEKKELETSNLSSNADQNQGGESKDGGGVAALLDGDATTYFHSRWGGTEVHEAHYVQIDLGADMLQDKDFFNITYTTRKVANVTYNSPAPTKISLMGSADGVDYREIGSFDVNDGLPSYKQAGQQWTSAALNTTSPCRYLRFVVTESAGPSSCQYGGQYFFGISELGVNVLRNGGWMAKPGMIAVTSELLLNVDEGVKTAETAAQGELSSAKFVEVQARLQEKYNALKEAREASLRHELSVSSYGFAGLYLAKNAEIPADVKVYVVNEVAPTHVHLVPVEGGVLPANTGAIVEANEGKYTFNYTDKSATVESLLKGSVMTQYIQGEPNTNYYMFGVKNGKVGLYKAWLEYNADGSQSADIDNTDEGGYFKVSAHKVYLPEAQGFAANALSFVFDDVTGVDELVTEKGKSVIYDLQGRRIYSIQKSGLYIVNGQKKFIKK